MRHVLMRVNPEVVWGVLHVGRWFCYNDRCRWGTDSLALALGSALVHAAWRAIRALNTRHKMEKFCTLGSCMRIEINYQAESLEAAICEAIVTYLGCGMPACEIIDQLISRGLIRNPGNNAREDVVQRLAVIAEQMRRERAT